MSTMKRCAKNEARNNILKMFMAVRMPDGSVWEIPAIIIAINHANEMKSEYDDDFITALNEDTIPIFENDETEIISWAEEEMTWLDVVAFAKRRKTTDESNMLVDEWPKCIKDIISK